jgi:HAE1 family hydrophobic/amphiphilic exporter-1
MEPEINVQVDRDKMSALGLTLQTVGMTMQTAYSGNTDGKFRAGEYEYDISTLNTMLLIEKYTDVGNLIFINSQVNKSSYRNCCYHRRFWTQSIRA